MSKLIKVITIIASIVVVTLSIIQLSTSFMISALSPFCLCIVMFGLWYQYRESHTSGKVSKRIYKLLSVLFIVGAVSNIVAGVAQFMNIENKNGSVAIIGGADGPTAIYLSGSFTPLQIIGMVAFAIGVLAVVTAVIVKIIQKKK